MKKLYSVYIPHEYYNPALDVKRLLIANTIQGALDIVCKHYGITLNFWYDKNKGFSNSKVYHIAGTKKTVIITEITENEPYFMVDYEFIIPSVS